MSSSTVEKIKEKLEISEVVGSYLKLEKAGANFKGKCPFHNEKTPSFFVSPSRGSYYCFGCGAKGDIFSFVQEFEGLDFIGSLKLLAERAGVEISEYPKEKDKGEDKLYEVMERATVFFEKGLTQEPSAKKYLLSRGISEETTAIWRIGFVPKDWRLLYTHLKEQGISEKEMEDVGLIKKSETPSQGPSWYDVFRGRILFPIFNTSGRVIAFSGRILEEDPKAPKYLNSPETTLFLKSETLYGFHRAKSDIRRKDYSVLVEGQMDLLLCHQNGFTNTIASSGTAFTEMHLEKLRRLSNKLLLAFDSDNAGFEAAKKSATLALSMGMEVKIADLPKGKDPADLIFEDLDGWRNAIRNAKHLIDFHLDSLSQGAKDGRAQIKEVEKKILPYLTLLSSSIEQAHFVSQISKKTGIREEAIWNDLRKLPRKAPGDEVLSESAVVDIEIKKRKNYIERRLVGIIFWQESKDSLGLDPQALRIKIIAIIGDEQTAMLFRNYEKMKEELIFEAESYYGTEESLVREVEELLLNFEEDIFRDRFVMAMNELQMAEDEKDEEKTKVLLTKCQSISVRLADISKKRIGGS